jgi:hypothetical protein
MNFKTIGWLRALRGLREGDQMVLITGMALIALQWLRAGRSSRTLVYRKKMPVGSTLVIRHADRSSTRLDTSRLLGD